MANNIKEVLQLHWMDAAKMSGGAYANETSLSADQALATINQLVLDEVIGENHVPNWDDELGMCHTCGWYVEDGTQDCTCIAVNKKLNSQRQALEKLMGDK